MKKIIVNIFEVAMRFLKSPLLCLLIMLAMSGMSQAQHIGCDDLVKSHKDTLRIPFHKGGPGDTVLTPIILNNDSIVTAFQFLIEYDTTWLRPVFQLDSVCAEADSLGNCITWNVDSFFVEGVPAGRFVKTDTTIGPFGLEIDTITKFTANLFQGLPNVIAGNFLPEFDDFDSLPRGNDIIFYLKFFVDSLMPESTMSEFTFYESDIFTINDTVFPPETTWYNGCNESQMTTVWEVIPDSTVSYQIYPTTDLGFPYYFMCDTTTDTTQDPIVTLIVSPSSIEEGETATLAWSSSYADSVIVRIGTTQVGGPATGGSETLSGLSEGTYNYTATAYGPTGKTSMDAATLTVTPGGGGDGPSINVVGVQTSYNQGELISFTVSATNTGGSEITISASSLPANASYGVGGQVIGYSPLSGTFGWTPDMSQYGAYSVRFTATDAEGTSFRDVVLQVERIEYDRLFSTSTPGNQPVGGLPGKEGVAFPIDMVTQQTVYGVQFDMLYPASILRVDSFTTSIRTPEYVIYDNIGVTPGNIRVVTFGLDNQPVIDTNTTAILYAYLTIDSSTVPWDVHWIFLENGRESINPDPAVGSLPLVTDSGVIEIDKYGDVNLDKIIDVADVVNIVAYIIGNFGLTPRQFDVADVIINDAVNVFDLVGVINLIYGIPLPPPLPPAPGQNALVSLAYDDMLGGTSDLLTVRSEISEQVPGVAGVQLELNYDPNVVMFDTPRLTSDAENFVLRSSDNGTGRLKILMYHLAPFKSEELIPSGMVDLVEIPIIARGDIKAGDKTKIRLTEALLATATAGSVLVEGVDAPLPTTFVLRQNYPNPFNPITRIEFTVGISNALGSTEHVTLDVFNVLGQKVATLMDDFLQAGEYFRDWGATDRNGQRVASGVYLYRLKVGDEQQTKKMLLLK